MNFKPILFSTEMIRAIMRGMKKQTRRLLKLKHVDVREVGVIHPDGSGKGWIAWQSGKGITAEFTKIEYPGNDGFACPYGSIGDVLWVREEHYAWGWWDAVEGEFTARGKQKMAFMDHTKDVCLYPGGTGVNPICSNRKDVGWHKRLGRFMPKKYCRIFLEITDIRVERLKDISEQDAKAEGVKPNGEQKGGEWFHYMRGFDDFPAYSATESFFSLWEKINGKENLEANPWVWAVSFTRIDKPEGFV